MLTEARNGEIARLILKSQLRKKGVTLDNNFRRDIGNEAKNLGIPHEEMLEFVEKIVREIVEETFAKKN